METFSALLAICAGNSPVPGEFLAQRPVTLCFDVFFDLRLNKRLSKHSWGWWFETLSCPIWRHSNDLFITVAGDGLASAGTVTAMFGRHIYKLCQLVYWPVGPKQLNIYIYHNAVT